MTYDLRHGTDLVDDALLAQEVEVQHKVDISKVLGMEDDVCEVKHAFAHTHENSGSVKGQGDITITPGVADSGVTAISGGVTIIELLKYKQTVNSPSDWEYSWFNWPHAA